MLVCGLAVANQELILPEVAEELQKGPDDDGRRKVQVYSNYDSNGILISGKSADRASRTVLNFNATLPVQILGVIRELQAKQARYIGPENPRAPLKGGWLLRGARISLKDPGSDEPLKTDLLVRLDDLKGFPPPVGDPGDLEGETYFLKSDLTFQAVSRSRQWYQFASTMDLMHSLSDPANSSERMEIAVFLHGRILRSLLSLNLMFLSLPIVLGGVGGNMFINLALSLGLSGVFYARRLHVALPRHQRHPLARAGGVGPADRLRDAGRLPLGLDQDLSGRPSGGGRDAGRASKGSVTWTTECSSGRPPASPGTRRGRGHARSRR